MMLVYFAAAAGLLALALLVFRVVVHRDYQRRGRLGWFAVALEFLVFALHGSMSYLYIPADWPALPALPSHPLHRAASLLLITVGLVAALAGMAGLGWGRVFGQSDAELRQSGLYRLTRNPQILAYGLAVLGYALLWPSWYALGWALLYAAVAHVMVLTEEEHLRRLHGQAYARYCQRVPRYLGLGGR